MERRQDGAVGLRDSGAEVLAEGLLLDEDVGGGNVAVDEAVCGVDVGAVLELYVALVGVLNAEDAEKADPERLRLSLLVSLAGPESGELAGGGLLVGGGGHGQKV